MTKTEVSRTLDVSINTVTKVCRTFQAQRLGAIERKKPNREYKHRLDGEAEAHLIAITCSAPPEGHERWTLRLLQAEMVKCEYVADTAVAKSTRALDKQGQRALRLSTKSAAQVGYVVAEPQQ